MRCILLVAFRTFFVCTESCGELLCRLRPSPCPRLCSPPPSECRPRHPPPWRCRHHSLLARTPPPPRCSPPSTSLSAMGGGAAARAPAHRRATLPSTVADEADPSRAAGLRAERTGRGRELILHGASGAVWLGPRAPPPPRRRRRHPARRLLLGPLVLRRCGLEWLLRGERAAAARAFPAWEWMGDARGGAKRADPKGGALNHAWVPTENALGVARRSRYKNIHTHTT